MRVQKKAIAIIALLATVCSVYSQSIVVVNTNARSFPTVVSKTYSFDATGAIQTITNADVTITDNGQASPGIVECDPPTSGRSASIVVMIDVSSTAGSGTTPTAIGMAKAGALAVSKVASATADELGLQTYDQNPLLRCGLTTSKPNYEASVADVRVGEGTNFTNGLNSKPSGGLIHLQNARNQRSLIVFARSSTRFNVDEAISLARSFRITVYVVGINVTLTADQKKLADSTGGAWVQNLTTLAEVETHARAYAAAAKAFPACNLTWTSSNECSRQHDVKITRGSIVRNLNYTVPTALIPSLEMSTNSIEFGETSSRAERTFMLVARNKSVVINSVELATGQFTIVTPIPPGKVLAKDEQMPVTVAYDPVGTDGTYRSIKFNTDACEVEEVYLHGGNLTTGDKLRLTGPKNGEAFIVGDTISITWMNALPTDVVRIDVSYDDGVTWNPVTENGSGLRYDWTATPGSSSSGKFRIQRTLLDKDDIQTFSGNTQPVYDASFTLGDEFVVTGGHDGTVRLYNAQTGIQLKLLGTHSNWVWSIGAHPSKSWVASGSHDGTVKIWDYESGERLATIAVNARVWSVQFSPDGSKLLVGAERSFAFYNTVDWSTDTIIQVTTGPVYNARYNRTGNWYVVTDGPKATLYDANSNSVLRSFVTTADVTYTAAITADGKRVCTGSSDFSLRIWDATTGSLTKSTTPAVGSILAAHYSPDDNRIIASGIDGVAKSFDSYSLGLLNTFAGHGGAIYGTKYNSSGSSIVTASTDFTARAWNILTAVLAQDVASFSNTISGTTAQGSTVKFADQIVGLGHDLNPVVITNTGLSPLVVKSARVTTGAVTDFSVTNPTPTFTVPPGGNYSLNVNFAPTSVGARNASAVIETAIGSITIPLSGNGLPTDLVMPSSVNFGRRIALQTVVDSTVLISTGPNQTVSVTRVILTGIQANHFSITSGGGPFSLNGQTAHPITFRFQPLELGKFAAVVEYTLGNGKTRYLQLYGEGTGDAAIRFSTTGLLYVTDKCNPQPSTQSVKIGNTGNSTLLVYTLAIEGRDANAFTLSSLGNFPVEIGPNKEVSLDVTYTPLGTGSMDANLIVSSSAINADNGTSIIPLIARRDSVGFELSRPIVDFISVPEGDSAVEKLLLINTGTVGLRWNRSPITVGDFIIDAVVPDVTPPGGYSEVTVRFKGGIVGNVYQNEYVFNDSVCSRSAVLKMTATVRSYIGCTIKIGNSAATSGSAIQTPIYITNKVNFDRTKVTSITARILVNGTVLVPQSGDRGTVNSSGERRFEITIPIPASDSFAMELPLSVLWGNDTASVIRVDSVWTSDTILIRSVDGRVNVLDICRDGGVRLITISTLEPNIIVTPQPTSGSGYANFSIVDKGLTTITLVDLNGRIIATLVSEKLPAGSYTVPIQTVEMESGLYFIHMQTATENFTTRFEVVK